MFAPVSATSASRRASPPGRSGTRVSRTSRRPASVSCRRAIAASRPASTLPPESTATVVPAAVGFDLPAEQRGHADRAGALDDELAALHQQRHRLGGRRPRRRPPGRRASCSSSAQRQLARALDRDAVGDRQRRVDRHRLAAPAATPGTARTPRPARRRSRTSGRADLTAIAMPAHSPPPPTGTTTLRQVGHVLEQLEPERALAGDDRPGRRTGGRTPGRPRARARARASMHSSTPPPPTCTIAP